MGSCCPWPRDTFLYDGLCSHSPMGDTISGDFELSPEQLEEAAADAKAKMTIYHAERYQREVARSPDRVRTEHLKSGSRYRKNHPDRVRASHKVQMARAREQHKYHCAICDIAFRQLRELNKHNTSRRHLQKMATTAGVLGDYHCNVCDVACRSQERLEAHNATQLHLQKVAATTGGPGLFHCEVCDLPCKNNTTGRRSNRICVFGGKTI